jgi:hypothetical protein
MNPKADRLQEEKEIHRLKDAVLPCERDFLAELHKTIIDTLHFGCGRLVDRLA